MAEQIICPTCRSVLLPHGHIVPPWEATASLQVLNCPIEGTPIYIPADQRPGVIPVGYTWDYFEVIKNNYSGIGWKEVTERIPELKINIQKTGDNPSLYPTVQELPAQAGEIVGKAVGQSATVLGSAAGNAAYGFLSNLGTPILIIGVIVILILLSRK